MQKSREIRVSVDDVEGGVAPIDREECRLVAMDDYMAIIPRWDGERIETIRGLMLAGF